MGEGARLLFPPRKDFSIYVEKGVVSSTSSGYMLVFLMYLPTPSPNTQGLRKQDLQPRDGAYAVIRTRDVSKLVPSHVPRSVCLCG